MVDEMRREGLSAAKRALLAKRLRGGAPGAPSQVDAVVPAVVSRPAERYEPFPLTDIQQAYFVGRAAEFELGDFGTHSYAEVDSGALDVERLGEAFRRLIDRHDMLRAIVLPTGMQVVLEQVPRHELRVIDLRDADPETSAARLTEVREEMSHQVFPSDVWPLFDLRVSLLPEGRVRLHSSFDVLTVDASSFQILLRELWALYSDPAAALPALTLTFRDYVLAAAALRETAIYRASEAYWHARLDTMPPPPELPLAVAPEAVARARFVRRQLRLERAAWIALKRRAGAAGLTPSGLLLAVFAEVLATWSRAPAFTLNLTVYNRLPIHPDVGKIIGDFTSVTLLAVERGAVATFEERAQALQQRLIADLEHRHFSGVQVARDLARRRGAGGGRGAAMPVVFTSVLQQSGQSDEARASLGLEPVFGISQTSQVWIDCQAEELEGALVTGWDSVEELFPEGLIAEMFAAYERLVVGLAGGDELWRATHLALVPPAQLAERARANATDQHAPPSALLHEPFVSVARAAPQRVAVITPERTFTYGELDATTDRLARRIRATHLRPGELVGVVMEKGWEQVAAVLAVLKAGAAYLPIDAALPTERLRHLIARGEVRIVLTQPRLDAEIAWPDDLTRLVVDDDDADAPEVDAAPVPRGPHDLAYVIFTSGSTGEPKGVMIEHGAALNTVLDINRRFDVGASDRVLALSALGFDLSVYDIFGVLAAGGGLVVPAASSALDPAHWAELAERSGVTIWNSVPALLEVLVEQLTAQRERLPPSLRLVMLSGDWIPLALPGRIRAIAPAGTCIVSLGGATEAAIWSIAHPIERVEPHWASVPYGRPLANQRFHVLDAGLEPRPIWVPGELYIAGVGLTRGYWRDEAQTAQAFRAHPVTGERLYRTGDWGRYLPGGEIEFLGREDSQVKIQGHRIELGEVEAALSRHPAVQAAVAVAVGELRGGKRLVAYVVARPEVTNATPSPGDGTTRGGLDAPALAQAAATLELKLERRGLRRDLEAAPAIALAASDVASLEVFTGGRAHATFDAAPVGAGELGALLSALRQVEVDGITRGRYPSSGSLYPVQTYVYVKPGRATDLASGAYYYDPQAHRLILLERDKVFTSTDFPAVYRAVFEQAAFALFFVADLDAITPVYGELAREFCALEGGSMSQLLMTEAGASGLGVYPVGWLELERLRGPLALGPSHRLVHALLGGRIDRAPARDDAELSARATAGRAPDLAAELREHVRRQLPAYMVPTTVVVLPSLPLTPNGKVDRRALPAPRELDAEPPVATRLPTGAVEEALAALAAQVLRVEHVGVHDNLFELGANSLHATQLVSRVRKSFKIEIPLRALFDAPTVAGLARTVEAQRRTRAKAVSAPLERVSRDAPLPMSFAQEGLWLHQHFNPESTAYNAWEIMRLTGDLDVASLHRAVQRIVDRHEVLRTTFTVVGGVPVQIVGEPALVPLPQVDLRGLPPEERMPAAVRMAELEAIRPYVLDRGPLLRLVLMRTGEREHLLLHAMHHLVWDGWSSRVLVHEFLALYKRSPEAPEPALPELPIQYADFATWQRRELSGPVLEAQLAYWTKQLAGAPPVLELPSDRPRPRIKGSSGANAFARLDLPTTEALRALSRREGASLFMTLLAALSALLSRYTGETDVVVGTVIANRTRVEIEELIGFFLNVLVLRTDMAGSPSFHTAIGRAREVALGAYANQDLPFEKLVEALNPPRDPARTPLFQVMLVLQNASVPAQSLAGLEAAPLDSAATSKFDLTVEVVEMADGLRIRFEYDTGLFEAATAQRMAGHLCSLLRGAVAHPDRPIDTLPLMSEGERSATLAAFAAHAPRPPEDLPRATVVSWLAASLPANQAAIACVAGDRRLSYDELDRQTNRLARYLREAGVGRGARVGVLLERGLDLVVALLGVLKAGSAWVPLDLEHPSDRTSFIIDDARVAAVVTTRAGADRIAGRAVRVVQLDRDGADIAAQSDRALAGPAPSPDELAYVMYTSGSSGRPKGVMVSHRALSSHMRWFARAFPLGPSDVILQKTPFGFDASVWEFFAPLLSGAVLAMAAPGVHRDPYALAEAVIDSGASTLQLVPTMLRALSSAGVLARCASLRRVFVGGEPLTASDCARLLAECPQVDLVNLYGPTEATIDATSWICPASVPPTARIPIGQPVDGMRAHVLDASGAPVPPGVAGELYLGGDQLARGYVNRPSETAAAFVPDPFGAIPGARLYRTGDVARARHDGVLEFLGRRDDQVKLRGFRLELGEVEAALRAEPHVRDAAVQLVHGHDEGDARLVAYVAFAEALPADAGAGLRAALAHRLPAHMVPSTIVVLDELPRTTSGKIDRRALPAPVDIAAIGTATEVPIVPPRTDLERTLVSLWEDVLAVAPVGITQSFFALGGHSLLAIRLRALAAERFSLVLPVALLLEAPTIERLAAALTSRSAAVATRSTDSLVALRAEGAGSPLVLVHPVGGDVFCYRALADQIHGRPIYAIRARGLDDGADAGALQSRDVADLARDYLARVRAADPRGPYLLGGWSMGGAVAFEMARQLRAAGERVGGVLLLDTWPPGVPRSLWSSEASRVLEFAWDLGIRGAHATSPPPEWQAWTTAARLAWVGTQARALGLIPGEADDRELARRFAVYAAHTEALARYRPAERYPGRVSLVCANETYDGADPAPDAAWRALVTEGVDLHVVPGDHYAVLSAQNAMAIAAVVDGWSEVAEHHAAAAP